jgi:hypothetical protein
LSDTVSGSFVSVRRGDGEFVCATVDIGVGSSGEVIHRFEDRDRLLGRRARIEEVDPVVEDREVGF